MRRVTMITLLIVVTASVASAAEERGESRGLRLAGTVAAVTGGSNVLHRPVRRPSDIDSAGVLRSNWRWRTCLPSHRPVRSWTIVLAGLRLARSGAWCSHPPTSEVSSRLGSDGCFRMSLEASASPTCEREGSSLRLKTTSHWRQGAGSTSTYFGTCGLMLGSATSASLPRLRTSTSRGSARPSAIDFERRGADERLTTRKG